MSKSKSIECPYCKGQMKRASKGRGNVWGLLCALMMFAIGLVITILIPLLGWVVGPIICLYALTMGGNKKSFWRCVDCGSTIDRN
jgi:hypothetical protein